MVLKTAEQSLRSPLDGKELDSMLGKIFPGCQQYTWWALEKPAFPASFFASTDWIKKGPRGNDSQDPRTKEVWISQGKDNHFLNQSLCIPKRQEILFEFWFCLLSKPFNLRSPSVFICKQPFLNDPTGFSGQSSHAGSRSSLGLPVPLASPCAHLYPPPLPSSYSLLFYPGLFFS